MLKVVSLVGMLIVVSDDPVELVLIVLFSGGVMDVLELVFVVLDFGAIVVHSVVVLSVIVRNNGGLGVVKVLVVMVLGSFFLIVDVFNAAIVLEEGETYDFIVRC